MNIDDLMNLINDDHEVDYDKTAVSPRVITTWDNLKNRVLEIWDVDESLLSDITPWIMYWNRQDKKNNIPVKDRKHITLLLNGYGGSADVTTSLIGTCLASSTPIDTVCMGVCYSANFFLYLVGETRYALKGSTFLIHQGGISGNGMTGNFEEVQHASEAYKQQIEFIKDWTLSRTNIKKPTLTKKWKSDWWVGLKDAENYGIVTKEIESLDEIL